MEDVLKLRANPSHPTSQKLERVIQLMETLNLEIEFINDRLVIHDHDMNVCFDFLDADDNKNILELPPLFVYKLVRDKEPNPLCECRHCNPNFER